MGVYWSIISLIFSNLRRKLNFIEFLIKLIKAIYLLIFFTRKVHSKREFFLIEIRTFLYSEYENDTR